MKSARLPLFLAALASSAASPALAQSMPDMPGMVMPKPAPKATRPATKPVKAHKPAKPTTHSGHGMAQPTRVTASSSTPVETSTEAKPAHASPAMPMDMPMPEASTPHTMPPVPGTADHANMPGMPDMHGTGTGHHMAGALGSYPVNREASGTSWQPDSSDHMGLMRQVGDWSLMGHGVLNLVADHQGGPRGDDKLFASGMLMGMANRPLGGGTLQFKAMLSPDPFMGRAGYPLLLASGETANGVDRLIDRQHPHDLFMELSASVSQPIGKDASLFVYGALPGEPAFGPPAFMHREAILDSPEAPITHHWLDSTHIAFGVVTAGAVVGNAKLEISRFNGREPDQRRYNIETGPLDSTALRLSWNPTRNLALQGSWGHFVDPEQLEPGVNQKRLSASALYANEIATGYKLAVTAAWGRKTVEGASNDAFALESSLRHELWTVFGRAEVTENSELVPGVEHGPSYRVGKASLGVVRDFRVAPHLLLGLGGLASINAVPAPLAAAYGGRHPTGAMAFVRIKTD